MKSVRELKKSANEKINDFFLARKKHIIKEEHIYADNGLHYQVRKLNKEDTEVSLFFEDNIVFQSIYNKQNDDKVATERLDLMKNHPIFKMSKEDYILLEKELGSPITYITFEQYNLFYKIYTKEGMNNITNENNRIMLRKDPANIIDLWLEKFVKMGSDFSQNYYSHTINKDFFIMCIDIFDAQYDKRGYKIKNQSVFSIYSNYDKLTQRATFCIREPSNECHYMIPKISMEEHKEYFSELVFNWMINNNSEAIIAFKKTYNIDKTQSYNDMKNIVEMILV